MQMNKYKEKKSEMTGNIPDFLDNFENYPT